MTFRDLMLKIQDVFFSAGVKSVRRAAPRRAGGKGIVVTSISIRHKHSNTLQTN